MDISAAVISRFREYYPYFSDTSKYNDDLIKLSLAYSDQETSGVGWGSYEDNPRNLKQSGMFTWSAHWMYTTYPAGSSNMSPVAEYAVSSKSVGDESVSYAVDTPSMNYDWFMKTKWGQQYLQLQKRASLSYGMVTI